MLGPNEECPAGTEITYASRCKEASLWAMSLGLYPERDPQIDSWDDVPLLCSVQVSSDTIHFNARSSTNNDRFNSGAFVMICEGL